MVTESCDALLEGLGVFLERPRGGILWGAARKVTTAFEDFHEQTVFDAQIFKRFGIRLDARCGVSVL